ncbi:glutathione S-transferase family protein [Cupriavidus sp. 2TAF22]|uniref:glutathione S-transferase family protein n=1 Tax=unclassified Cupriavidus TaxID=2640874 RepID=UPI003F90978B
MTLKIYGIAASRAIRPLWAAEELGLAYENIPLHYASAQAKAPAYLAINPNGTVPAIDDDGLVIYESLAITLYLARKHAGQVLCDGTAGQDAGILQWTLWAATMVEPHLTQWSQHTRLLPQAQRDPAQAAAALAALAALRKPLAVLDAHCARQPYLLGDTFTVADLNVASVLHRLADIDACAFTSLTAWHQRCVTRPAAQRAFALRQQAA